jgi:energy-coupling factor transporter transmembrane protein EcfT
MVLLIGYMIASVIYVTFLKNTLENPASKEKTSYKLLTSPSFYFYLYCIIWMLTPYNPYGIIFVWIVIYVPSFIIKKFSVSNIYPFSKIPLIVLFFLIIIPIGAIQVGIENAYKIKKKQKTRIVKTEALKKYSISIPGDEIAYLGLAGEYLFFWGYKDSNIYMIKTSQLPILPVSKDIYKLDKIPILKTWGFIKDKFS